MPIDDAERLAALAALGGAECVFGPAIFQTADTLEHHVIRLPSGNSVAPPYLTVFNASPDSEVVVRSGAQTSQLQPGGSAGIFLNNATPPFFAIQFTTGGTSNRIYWVARRINK